LRLVTLVLLSLLVAATGSLAQEMQWLQYHITRQERSLRWLALTTNAPPNVALPTKFNATPYFAHWSTALDPKGRWLCFDRSSKSGAYDRLFIDTTGDGRLDNKLPLRPSGMTRYGGLYSEPVRLVFKGEDGPVTYHLLLPFMTSDSGDARLLTSPGGFYSGAVDFAGKKHRIELIDGNVNGAFNDLAANPDDCDQVALDGQAPQALGRLLEVDGQFYRIEVARDGAFIKVQKATDVALGTVRLPAGISEFTAVGENGQFTRKPAQGEVTLPAGAYRIGQYVVDRKDERGAAWRLRGFNFPSSAGFQVAADKPVSLDVGEPVRLALESSEFGGGEVSFRLPFRGRRQETVEITRDNDQPPPPRLTLVSLDGSYRYVN
jgi:hypothetical protein